MTPGGESAAKKTGLGKGEVKSRAVWQRESTDPFVVTVCIRR